MSEENKDQRLIEIHDIGAVSRVKIPIPVGGGVVVLRGRNGCGKSTALDAVSALAEGKRQDRTQASEGTKQGSVEGLGLTMKFGGRTSKSGELELEAISGVNIWDFVDPGISGEEGADRARIKAMCRLVGVKVRPELFDGLVVEEDREMLRAATDLGSVAAAVRKRAQEHARGYEEISQKHNAEAVALRQLMAQAGGEDYIKMGENREGLLLREASFAEQHEECVVEKSVAERLVRESEFKRKSKSDASGRLSALGERPDVSELVYERSILDCAEEKLEADVDEAVLTATRAQESLTLRREALARNRSESGGITIKIESVSALAREYDAVKALADVECPSQEEAATNLQQRVASVAIVVKELEQVRSSLAALDLLDTCNEAVANESGASKAAAGWRNVSSEVDQVIERHLAGYLGEGASLCLQNGALFGSIQARYETSAPETMPVRTRVSQMSVGERCRIGIDMAVAAVGAGALIVIKQEAWEGLDPTNRKEIAEHARSKQVTVVTAECSDDESVEATVFGGIGC